MRDIIFAYLRERMKESGAQPWGRFDNPLIMLPYHGGHTKYSTDADFIATLWISSRSAFWFLGARTPCG